MWAIHRGGQGRQVIPAFERREDASAGMTLGDAGHDAGEIRIALFRQPHARERIVFVRIEAGGDDHKFRFERIGRRHQRFLKDGA